MWYAIAGVLILAMYMGSAQAAPVDFTTILSIFKTLGSATVPTTIPQTSVISVQVSGPKVIDFIKSEQGKGQAILIPADFLKHKINTGDQILSVNPVWVEPAIQGGVFVLLPRI